MIEEYISFWIDNGCKTEFLAMDYANWNDWNNKAYTIELITSQPFIEAIARGYVKNNNPTHYWEVEGIWKFKSEHGSLNVYDEIVEQITILQAISIRDGSLEEFIKHILINK